MVQPMKPMHRPVHFSLHFSTAIQKRQTIQHRTEDFLNLVLDKGPDVKTLKIIHSKIISDPILYSNTSLAIKLMRAYAACGKPSITRNIFDKIPERNNVIFNVMIRSYVNNQFYKDAIFMYKSMLFCGVVPDHYTLPCMLKACSSLNNLLVGVQIHSPAVKKGLDLTLFTGNGLIAMYGKCGFLVDARHVLDAMPYRDIVSWNSMVAGYAQNGRFDDALEVCKEMGLLGVKPDSGTMASLSPAVTNTSKENVMFVKEMFMSVAREELVAWNVMIAVYSNNSMPREAVELYLQMEAQRLEPDAITIASVLPACGDLSAVSLGMRVHEFVETKGLRPNLSVENALIDMYAKCGCLSEAREVFDGMQLRDVVSWTSLMSAYGRSGEGHRAIELFANFQDLDLIPDSIAFVSVLSACSHAGLLSEGRQYYRLMTDEYKIVPRLEHCACMVDLLGRAGQVEEAYNFISQMPMEPNDRVWGALLNACHVYNNMDIGIVAADHLFQLAPEQSGYYVLLSNIYAKAGRWKDVASIRSIMKGRGIKKVPGVSNVELHNQVHTFLAGDRWHPQSMKIYEELDVLVGKMKEAGYIPKTDTTLHDVEEEDKENHLAVHSEKLAIVFAIINTEPGAQIRVTKNLRVCEDCHIAIKFMSKITERKIALRDSNRYHHYENGICSCGDYW
ncbi:putative pentatricopeptide repeat-containing protein At3g49142 [Olea europaea var. sylvestris]|uniref:putative pentatricopeptide repeat-containing protein At3g49142 n=1 Tax=Olea europaea var. sylvestris TaxID=158386 RepID=UPI000C1D4B40|nr:putative pentatricopeptide repeat-containing protein At3g49142 [Olea europaea var. sylvestris]XP_022853750.1 putative pentatricopeptide repeat-containing protein At3g49142 [Olea europaea var. sylvestris]